MGFSNKTQLIRHVAMILGMKETDVRLVISEFLTNVMINIAEKGEVQIEGFGTFHMMIDKSARTYGRQLDGKFKFTNQLPLVHIPVRRTISFKKAPEFRRLLRLHAKE